DVLEPIEADTGVFHPLADVDRLLDPPALIDVAHQIRVGADRLADQASLLNLARRRGDAGQPELHLGLAMTFLAYPPRGGDRFFELEAAPQRAARIGRNAVATAAQELPQRQTERFAL